MTRVLLAVSISVTLLTRFAAIAQAQYGAAVVSYNAGATPAVGFTTASAAIGPPERFTGEGSFPGIVSPFSPPFLPSEIVSVGEGGHITLRLSHYAIPQNAGSEIGIFENVGLIFNDTTGGAGPTAVTFGHDNAIVEVSAEGTQWISLGNNLFNIPSNGYSDLTDPFATAPGSVPSDFQQPFTADLTSFNGLPHFNATGPDVLDLLAGSGGGKWLDISGTGLAQVGFIRFSVADDMNTSSNLNFELDAVSIAHAAMGATVVPEPITSALLVCVVLVFPVLPARRRSQNYAQ